VVDRLVGSTLPVVNDVDSLTFLLKPLFNKTGDLHVVFDNEYAQCSRSFE
jgi:hypothetical protein